MLMRNKLFILAMTFSSSTAIAGSWANESDLTAHIAYTSSSGGAARLMVDFAFGNQCGPEVVVRMDAAKLAASDEPLVLQVDQRKQHPTKLLSLGDELVLASFTENTDEILKDLKAGNKVRVSVKEHSAQFSLSGSSAALAYAQRRCESLQ